MSFRNIQTDPNAPWMKNQTICPPFDAYGIQSDNEMGTVEIGQTRQLFYSRPVSADPLNPTPALFFNPNVKEIELVSASLPIKGERPWLLSVNAKEVARITEEGEPQGRLPQSTILKDGLRYSTLQSMIKVMDGSANSKIFKLDVCGGCTIPVYGRNVEVYILAPEITQIINSPSQTDVPLEGMIFDTIVSAKIAPSHNSYGNLDYLKYTLHTGIDRAIASTLFVEIPPSARRVRIISASDGAIPDDMYFWMTNNPTSGHNMGIINFTSDSSNHELHIPCGATHIYVGPDNTGCYSFMFLIDP